MTGAIPVAASSRPKSTNHTDAVEYCTSAPAYLLPLAWVQNVYNKRTLLCRIPFQDNQYLNDPQITTS